MVVLNLAEIQIGKEKVAFGTETVLYQPFPGRVSKGDVTPTIKEAEILINDMSSRNEAEDAVHGESEFGIKVKSRLQDGRPFYWLMGGYAVAAGIQIDTTGNTITFTDADPDTITRANGSWITDGISVGDVITIADSSLNDGTYTVTIVTALVITLTVTVDSLAAESMTTGTLLMSPPYQHTITNSNTIPSYSIEHVINAAYSHKFFGSKLDELTFTMTKGQTVISETTFKSATNPDPDLTPGDPTQSSITPYEFHQATTLIVNEVEYKCTTRQMVTNMSNGLEGDSSLCSRDVTSITEGFRKFILTLEIREADSTLLSLLKNRTEFAASIVVTRGDGDTITYTIPKAKLFEMSYDYGGNPVIDILPIRVISDWTIVVVDDVPTYDI